MTTKHPAKEAARLQEEARRAGDAIARESPSHRIVIVVFAEGDAFALHALRHEGKDLSSIVRALRRAASSLEQN